MIPAVPLVPGMLTPPAAARRAVWNDGALGDRAGRYTRRGQRAVAQLGERACFGYSGAICQICFSAGALTWAFDARGC